MLDIHHPQIKEDLLHALPDLEFPASQFWASIAPSDSLVEF
jgi:hypothetical protein